MKGVGKYWFAFVALIFAVAFLVIPKPAHAMTVPDWANGRDSNMAQDQVKAWENSSIHLYYGAGDNWYFGAEEIDKWIKWIDRGDSIWVELDKAKIYPSLDQIALWLSRPGEVLDKDAAVNQIMLTLRQPTDRQVQLKMTGNPSGTPSGMQLNRFPGMYIDVDVKTQTLSVVYWERVLFRSRVSTGKIGYDTPLGVRHINWHGVRPYSAKYKLWMPWWLDLGEGYGIHELPEWGNGVKEGANHLGIKVSHGCIRLGVGAAKIVWDMVPDGSSVYIHQ